MCKECASQYHRLYYVLNKETLAAKSKKYRELNKEPMAAARKAYAQNNPQAVAVSRKKYKEKNREKLLAYWRARYHRNKDANRESRRVYYRKNKERVREKVKQWYAKNRQAVAVRQKEYTEKNREALSAYHKQKYRRNREQILKRNAEWHKKRLINDPHYKVRIRLGTRLYQALKYRGQVKKLTMLTLVGCTRSELMIHLQNQFKPGMEWNNYGPVRHVDHIRPCASFDLTDVEQQKACFHWSNLQPLFGEENIKKGAAYEETQP